MQTQTRQKRMNAVVNVLITHKGVMKAINTWMTEINSQLCNNSCFTNTKELAKAFSYVSKSMNYNLIRTRKMMAGASTIVFYKYEPEV